MTQEITLPVAELKQALPGFSKLVAKSRSLPVLQSVRINRDVAGIVTIEGTDLEAHVTYRFKDTQPGQPAEVLVPLEALTKTAKGSSETLTLIPDGKDKIRLRYYISNSPIEQRITCPETKEWPGAPKFTTPLVSLDPQFGPTLKEALQCASDESSRRVLHGAHVDVSDPNAHYVVGTNGRVLYAANSFCFDLKESVTVPNLKILGWPGFYGEDICRLATQKDAKGENKWVRLQSGPWTVTARQIEGAFPTWRAVMPNTEDTHRTLLKLSPAAIEQVLRVLPQLPADQSNSGVRLRVAHHLFIEGRNKDDREWTSVAIPDVRITGNPVQVMLNRNYLAQALRYNLTEVRIENETSALVFSEGGRKFIVMPIRLQPDPSSAAPAQPTDETTPQSETEATAPASPSAEQLEPTPAVERNPMPTETTLTPPRRGNLQPPVEAHPNHNGNGHTTPLAAAISQIETVKTGLRDVITELNATLDLLRAAEKEKKTSAREVESVRATLRSLQKVAI